jgi:sterol desaturase/sphingolipid hydroxylase (fatty acid hydroxylase superfamily)
MFLLADCVQWSMHIQLHKQPWLWKFHKVHHSIKEMGFAAQFRFHFMEVIIYKAALYAPSALIRLGVQEFFILHRFGVFVGHLNHAKVGWDYG